MSAKRLVISAIIASTTLSLTLLGQDQALRRVPSDCLFCVQVNNLDQILGRLEEYLTGVTDPGLANRARSAIGEMLSNPKLTGIKTTGTFVLFGLAPGSKFDDAEAWLKSIYLLVPVTDYNSLVANTPEAGPADANDVRDLGGTGFGIVDVGGYALVGKSGNRLIQMARSIRSGIDRPLANGLDSALIQAAGRSGLWAYCNVQVLAKTLGPGIGQRIQELGRQFAGLAGPNTKQVEQTAAMYGGILEYLLTQLYSVTVTGAVSPDRLVLTKYVYATPGSQLGQALTRSGQTGPFRHLSYCQDGALASGAWRIQMARLIDLQAKLMEIVTAATGQKATREQIERQNSLIVALSKAMGDEMAFSMLTKPGAKPVISVRQVFDVKDREAFMKAIKAAMDGVYKDGLLSSLMADQTVGMKMSDLPELIYKDTQIMGMRFAFSFKDPNGAEAQVIRQVYGDGIETRIAAVGQVGLITWGANAQQAIQEMIDQVSSGGQRQIPSEIKAAMDLVGTRDLDMIFTLNYLRLLGAVMGAIMPIPIPTFPSSSNLVIAGNIDNGKATVQVILPKAHLMEITNLFKGIGGLVFGQGVQQ